MNVDTMRKIDFYAGVPLCAILSFCMKLKGLFTRGALPRPKNILLIELSEMGSTILADPAMRKLQRCSGAKLYFVIFAKNRPSLDLLGTIPPEQTFTIRDSGLIPLITDTVRFLFQVRRIGIDTVIDLELFSRFTSLLSGLSGAAVRVGFYRFCNEGLYRGSFLTHRVAYNPHQHISKNFIALVNALLTETPEHPYSKTIISDEETGLATPMIPAEKIELMRHRASSQLPAFDHKRHRIVLINANASELLPQRCWPPENYVLLAHMILDRNPDVYILCTGSPAERAGIEQIVTAVDSSRCINFAGSTTMAELIGLYSISTLMVSNDSGPAHFASVTPLPTYVLFGPETPNLYGPLGNSTPIYAGMACSPCVSAFNHRKTPCTENACLRAITPEQVYTALEPVLSGKARQQAGGDA